MNNRIQKTITMEFIQSDGFKKG